MKGLILAGAAGTRLHAATGVHPDSSPLDLLPAGPGPDPCYTDPVLREGECESWLTSRLR